MENAKIQKFKCDILDDFQIMCYCDFFILTFVLWFSFFGPSFREKEERRSVNNKRVEFLQLLASKNSSAKSHLQAVTCFGFLLRIQLSMRSTWTLSFVLKSLRKEIIKEEKNHKNGTETLQNCRKAKAHLRPAEAISDTLLHIAQTPIKRNERRARDPNTYTPAYQQASCHVPSIMQIGFTWQKLTKNGT